MKVVVTGALGHIGSKLIRTIPNTFQDLEIVMVDDLSTQRYCSLFELPSTVRYTFLENKVTEINMAQLLKKAHAVIHLAALTDAAGTADKPETVHENNFNSTKHIANACLLENVPFIFPSSTSVYGSQNELVDEECQSLYPQSPYADCKIKEETYIQKLFQEGLSGVICRLGTIYGVSPGMRFHTAVNKFCWQAVMNNPLTVWETALDQKRPYLDLRDCCDSFMWILQNKIFDKSIYNIVSNNFTVRNVINEIEKHVSDLKVTLVQHRIMNQLSYEVSSDKFRKTGFSFSGSLEDGIKKTISLLKSANNKSCA